MSFLVLHTQTCETESIIVLTVCDRYNPVIRVSDQPEDLESSHTHWVDRGKGRPKDRDEDKRREV